MKRSIFARLVSKLAAKTDVYNLIPPYDYVQSVVEQHLPAYIRKPPSDVKHLVIVGGYRGNEIPKLLKTNPSAKVTVFEASQRYGADLQKRFEKNDRVEVRNLAVSDKPGTATFYETNLRGSGSLLELGKLAEESYGAEAAESFEVTTDTLDRQLPEEAVDCIWIDVQGAELLVLSGGPQILEKASALFLEVALLPDLYKGGAVFEELNEYLKKFGFILGLLGVSNDNLTGNALYIKT